MNTPQSASKTSTAACLHHLPDPEVRRVLDARSHGAPSRSPAPQSNQPAVTLPMFITDASSYEARTIHATIVEASGSVALYRGYYTLSQPADVHVSRS